MIKKKIFLASSSELAEDRREFEIFIGRKNKLLISKGLFLELVMWEDFLDTVSRTRLQDEYNRAIRECDLFIMLFFTKVGQYTEEEFETAFGQFQSTNKPFIFTYFKDVAIATGNADKSLEAFMKKLDTLGHFYTRYKSIDGLTFHFDQQLDKLMANGFIEFSPDNSPDGISYNAQLSGSGAIAQGESATAVGAGGVNIGGDNTGSINTGKAVDTGGGAYVEGNINTGGDFVGRDKFVVPSSSEELQSLLASLVTLINQQAPPEQRAEALQQAEALKHELDKDRKADDGKLARIIEGLVDRVPGAIGALVNLFATPILSGIAGPITRYILDKLKGN
jgi:hypothetical protein